MLAYNHPFTLKESKTYHRRHVQRNKGFHALDKNFSAVVLNLHMACVSVLLKVLPPHNNFSPVLLLSMQILGCYHCTNTINIFWKDPISMEKKIPIMLLKWLEKKWHFNIREYTVSLSHSNSQVASLTFQKIIFPHYTRGQAWNISQRGQDVGSSSSWVDHSK